jgi:hypothetical protein
MSDLYNYNFYKILTERSIDIIDTKTLLTYGMIGITTIVLAVATLYDEIEENETEPEQSIFSQSEESPPLPFFGEKSSTGGKQKNKNRKTKRKHSKK